MRPTAAKSWDLATLWQIAAAGGIHAVIGHRLVDTGHKRGSAVVLIAEGGPGQDPGTAC